MPEHSAALVTGATGAIGRELVRRLIDDGTTVYACCRDTAAGELMLHENGRAAPGSQVIPLDFTRFDSVVDGVSAIPEDARIDLVINNAGRAVGHGLTDDGFQTLFAVNYLGHFLVTELLMRSGRLSTAGTVINVSSIAHLLVPGAPRPGAFRRAIRPLRQQHAYAVSKRCLVLHAMAIADRHPELAVRAVHPGATATPIVGQMMPGVGETIAGRLMQPPGVAADVVLRNARRSRATVRQGAFFNRDTESRLGIGSTRAAAEALYRWSENAIQDYLKTV